MGDSMKEIGEILKAKRLEKGLTIEQISQQTRMSLPHIKAIEEGNLDYFKNDLSYLRFFLHAYSDAVGADFEQIKMMLENTLNSYTQAFEVKQADEHAKMEENIQKNKKETKQKQKRKINRHSKNKSHGKLDFSLISFLAIVSLLVVCVLVVSGFYLVRNLNQVEPPTPPVIENNDKPIQQEEDEKPEVEPPKEIEIQKDGVDKYKILNASEKVVIKIEFVPSSWFAAYLDDQELKTPTSKIYDAGSVVEIELDPAVNQQLRLRFGYFAGMKMYVNEESVAIDESIANRLGTQDIYFEIGGNADEPAQ